MNRRFLSPLALSLALSLALAVGAPAQATTQAEVNAALRADAQIWDAFVAMAAAREISSRCAGIEAREFRARTHVVSLYNRARSMGFTRPQIMAFIDDEGEKARLRAATIAWFGQNGVRVSDGAEAFCALGRSQIAQGTQTGSYLRAR